MEANSRPAISQRSFGMSPSPLSAILFFASSVIARPSVSQIGRRKTIPCKRLESHYGLATMY